MLPLSLPALTTLGITGGAGGAARSDLNSSGSAYSASGAGDWNVNLGGSGTAVQSASSSNMLLILAAMVVLVVLVKK